MREYDEADFNEKLTTITQLKLYTYQHVCASKAEFTVLQSAIHTGAALHGTMHRTAAAMHRTVVGRISAVTGCN